MLEIKFDNNPINPREWDNVTTLVVAHRDYGGGDFNANSQDKLDKILEENKDEIEWAKSNNLFHRITAYIHSGISVRLDTYGDWPDQRWDCTPFGYIFINRENVKEMMGEEIDVSKLNQYLIDEFNEWKNYIEDDTYYVENDDYDTDFAGSYDECVKYVKEQNARECAPIADRDF